MIKREISTKIKEYLKKYPIVTLTGVRQCGKSTLLREELSGYNYVSLEDPDIRSFALEDPRGFLENYPAPCIFDEAQRAPELFSYLQTKTDKSGEMGQYVLSGSHNFLLMQSISQSLAGRTAVLTLAPLSLAELKREGLLDEKSENIMQKGFYPALYSRGIDASDYFPSYVQTYIEKDVRLLRNIPDAADFTRFLRILATRSGQVLNQTELSRACGLSVPTVRAWLSILEQSYVVFQLQPYYNNFTKRVVKTAKFYFYDTGLLCHLLGIENGDMLVSHPLKGAIFETMVVAEYMKSRHFAAKEPRGYYWRDTNQNEVDLLIENEGRLKAYEIKSGSTMERGYLKGLKKFAAIAGLEESELVCIYAGKSMRGEKGSFIDFREVFG